VSRTFGSGLEASAARALYQLGRWDEASETLERALGAGAVGSGLISLLSVRALVDVGRGRLAEAAATVSLADGLVGEHTPLDVRRWLTVAAVELAIWQGDGDAALTRLALAVADAEAPAVASPGTHPAILDASVPHLLALGARAVADVAIAERAGGQEPGLSALARGQLETALRRAEKRAALADVWAADLALARAELARGEGAEAVRRVKRWKSAAALLEDRPYVAAYAAWRLAEALLAQRDGRQAAAPLIEAAIARTDALGAGLLGGELRALARRARLEVGESSGTTTVAAGSERARAFGLTERESEVLALLADGLSNQEIAARLFISPKTASVHVSNIYAKLGVESRVAAATMAHEMGLDRSPTPEKADQASPG
jgi:DNA-binding NarL/FixJ family response regulator